MHSKVHQMRIDSVDRHGGTAWAEQKCEWLNQILIGSIKTLIGYDALIVLIIPKGLYPSIAV